MTSYTGRDSRAAAASAWIESRYFRVCLVKSSYIHDTLGDRPAALKKVAKALALAEPGGFIRLLYSPLKNNSYAKEI